jgi:two-component system chemotaxis response regulator CheY
MSDPHDAENLKRLKSLHILVVEDSDFDRELLVSTLKAIGIDRVQVAENGRIASSKVDTALAINKPFDMVISDWKMPSLDGHSLLKSIKGNSKLQMTSVIVTTGSSSTDDVVAFGAAGVDGYIVKPVTREVIEEKILKVLRERKKNV